MERLLKKELAPISGFETQLQYGVTLAELAKLFSPESVKKIFEVINSNNYVLLEIFFFYLILINEIYTLIYRMKNCNFVIRITLIISLKH